MQKRGAQVTDKDPHTDILVQIDRALKNSHKSPEMILKELFPAKKFKMQGIQPNVFGATPEEIVRFQRLKKKDSTSVIPFVVTETITWLSEHNALKEVGIFRVAGSVKLIEELKKKYNEEASVDLGKYGPGDIHSIAGLLKQWLRELPEPLFINRFYIAFLQVAQNTDYPIKMRNLKKLIIGLPIENKSTFYCVLEFLANVSQCEEVNKMGSKNLSIIFSRALFREPDQFYPETTQSGAASSTPPNIRAQLNQEAKQKSATHGNLVVEIVRQLIDEHEYILGKADSPKGTVSEDDKSEPPES